jgi:hypothetical protein
VDLLLALASEFNCLAHPVSFAMQIITVKQLTLHDPSCQLRDANHTPCQLGNTGHTPSVSCTAPEQPHFSQHV